MGDHEAIYIGQFMSDQYTCTCGWEGNSYFDGDYWAYQEFVKHKEAAENTLGTMGETKEQIKAK